MAPAPDYQGTGEQSEEMFADPVTTLSPCPHLAQASSHLDAGVGLPLDVEVGLGEPQQDLHNVAHRRALSCTHITSETSRRFGDSSSIDQDAPSG